MICFWAKLLYNRLIKHMFDKQTNTLEIKTFFKGVINGR